MILWIMPLHVHLGGEYPCRRLSLLGIAHPVVGKIFLGIGGTPREGTS